MAGKRLLAIFPLLPLIFFCQEAAAATINAASPELADVQAAIAAASNGDTVNVPAGSGLVTWNSQLLITKGISLVGPGRTALTVRIGHTGNVLTYTPANPAADYPFRVSGFHFNCTGGNGISLYMDSTTPQTKIRIDHNRFTGASEPVFVRGNFWGCIDNNLMEDMTVQRVLGGSTVMGLWNWNNLIFNFGSANQLYFEDNTVTTRQSFVGSCGLGGRYCARHNTITVTGTNFASMFDIHGNQDDGQGHNGGMGIEIYDNLIIAGGLNGIPFIDYRGGRGLFYNITVQGTGAIIPRVREEFTDSLWSGAPVYAPAFALMSEPDINAERGQPLHPSGAYMFLIRRQSAPNTIIPFERTTTVDYSGEAAEYKCFSGEAIVPTEDVHFWQEKTSFNGSSGVGVGPLANRPASASTEGVAWWATDEQRLYRWKNGAWELHYTPYTYPHPFRTNCVNYPSLCDSVPQPEAYWVSPTGASAWANCKSSTPLNGASACPLATANANAIAGDTVYLRGGTYSGITGSAINPSNTGTAGNMITFSSYNGEDAQLIGSGTSSLAVNLDSQCTESGTGNPIPCPVTRNYIKVHDLHFSNFNRHLWIRFGSHNEISYCSFIGMPSDTSNLDWSGSYIYRNAYYNWVHHSTFGDYGRCEPYGTDYGVVFQVGVESMLDSDFNNGYFTKYNLVENNEMYHGGHHVVSFNGINNVFRNNSFRNDPWCPLSNPLYATRTFFQTGVPGDGQYNLVEGNRIGYGGPKNKIEIGGAGGTIAGAYNIWRRNVFLQVYTDAMWVTFYEYQDHVKYNKIYNNDYWHGGYGRYQEKPGGTAPSDYWDYTYTHGVDIGEGSGSNVYDNVFKNNIFYQNSDYYGTQYSIISANTHITPVHQILENNWLDNAGDPKFVDISGTPVPALIATQFNFHLQSDSPCIDQGWFLTTITSSSGSGTQFQVADAGYFMDGWGIIDGDVIQLQGQTTKARITSVNYATNTITVNTTLSWTTGLGVALAYEGSAPDIGAYEYMNGSALPVPGDINGDGIVSILDLSAIGVDFGKTGGFTYARADTNSDSVVDVFDMVFVASRFI